MQLLSSNDVFVPEPVEIERASHLLKISTVHLQNSIELIGAAQLYLSNMKLITSSQLLYHTS